MKLGGQQNEGLNKIRYWLADPDAAQVFYLAGFAGTGKTTLARIIQEFVRSVLYAAYTGKAALVLTSKGCHASTIHSLIYKRVKGRDGKKRFVLNKDSDIKGCDVLVVDEISMVGTKIGQDLLSFGVKILVIGDPFQLPPVGDGGFFTKGEPDHMLTEIHRQAQDNPIIAMSMDIRNGKELPYGHYGSSRIIRRKQMNASDALNADILITGKNDTRRQWNRRMRELTNRSGRFVAGERVITLKNCTEKALLNGALWDVVEVKSSGNEDSRLMLRSADGFMKGEDRDIITHHDFLDKDEKNVDNYLKSKYSPVDYGYALSCHKSQGSQWGDTLVYDESYVFRENAGRWLYTAVTRAENDTLVVRD